MRGKKGRGHGDAYGPEFTAGGKPTTARDSSRLTRVPSRCFMIGLIRYAVLSVTREDTSFTKR